MRALLGGFVEMYGVGHLSAEPGIFIAAPAYQDGVSRVGTFVTDENGGVVMAHDGRLEYESMPGCARHPHDAR